MTTTAPRFFSPEWAEQARAGVDRGPGDDVRAGKLPTYWEWIDEARAGYGATWALRDAGLPGDPSYLLLTWQEGRCTRGAIVGSDGAADADYVLSAPHDVWAELLEGADPGRMLMYRRIRLERGDVLGLFRAVYLVVESLAVIARVPARMA